MTLTITKVCHLTSVHHRHDVRIFQKQCVSLARAGYRVSVIVNDALPSEETSGVSILPTGKKPKNRLGRMWVSQVGILRKAIEQDADIYQIHDPELLFTALVLKWRGKKVIFDSHEDYPTQIRNKVYIPRTLRGVIAAVYTVFETCAVRQLDAVIFPCPKNGKHLFESRARSAVFVDNYPRLEEFSARNIDPPYLARAQTVAYVGGLTEGRGVTNLVRAAHRAGARLVLAGHFVPAGYHEVLKALPEYSIVDYVGFLQRGGVSALLGTVRIGAAAILNVGQYNQYDNFATKVYEYMAMGLPVIISDSSYNRRVMTKQQFGLCVNPESVEEIAAAIRFLLDNPDEASAMGERGRRAVLEEYNWASQERVLLELYARLAPNDMGGVQVP